MIPKALRHLKKSDRVLHRHISKVGKYGLIPHRRTVYESLARAIVFQQLSGKAAQTIFDRFQKLAPEPADVLRLSLDELRTAGISRSKGLALKDLAQKTVDGTLPEMRKLKKMSDDEIVESLTQVRGIGPWTAQMFLMFRLHRLDVLPTADYGIRKAFAQLYKKRKLPTPEQLTKHAECWRPYRTVACWYLWRALD